MTWHLRNPASGADLSDADPIADGVADPGTSDEGSRADHVHPLGNLRNQASIVDPDVTSTVDHGLPRTPEPGEIQIQPRNTNHDVARYSVSGEDSLTFAVTVDPAPGTGNTFDFGWLWVPAAEAVPPVFSPDLTPDLEGWWEADDLTLTEGDPVSSWASRVGSLVLEQATSANQPTWHDNLIGGLPAVRFDGSNDFLAFITPLGLLANAPKTVIAVWQATGAGLNDFVMATRVSFGGVNNDARGYAIQARGGAGTEFQYIHTGVGVYGGNPTIVDGVPYLSAVRVGGNGTSPNIRWDAADLTPTASSLSTAINETASGSTVVGRQSGSYGGFELSSLLMFSRSIDNTEVGQNEGWLTDKYSL